MAKRILVVDDEPDIRRLVAEALQATGYDVQTSANGQEAVRAAGLFIPDLVLRLAWWLLLAPLLPGLINKVKAWVGGRRGPPPRAPWRIARGQRPR